MTQAKAAEVIALIVGAGYNCSAYKLIDGTWAIRSTSPNIDVPVGVICSFITNQSVNGFVSEVEYN